MKKGTVAIIVCSLVVALCSCAVKITSYVMFIKKVPEKTGALVAIRELSYIK